MTFQLFYSKGKAVDAQPRCLYPGCMTKPAFGRDYCSDHKGTCAECGKPICTKSFRCQPCAQKHFNESTTAEQKEARTRHLSQRVKHGMRIFNMSHADELKEVIRAYEDAWLAGKWPNLCQDALKKLRPLLKQMEMESCLKAPAPKNSLT